MSKRICDKCGYYYYEYSYGVISDVIDSKPCPKCGGIVIVVNNIYTLIKYYIKFGILQRKNCYYYKNKNGG